MRILHVISGLGIGGAQTTLLQLCKRLSADGDDISVISLSGQTDLASRFQDCGVDVDVLDMHRGAGSVVLGIGQLASRLRSGHYDLVHAWLYHAQFFATLAWTAARRDGMHLIWGVRSTDLLSDDPRLSYRLMKIALPPLSRHADRIVTNSVRGMEDHKSLGFRPRSWSIIPNGIDTALFHPDPSARRRLRTQLKIPHDALVICHAGRFASMKDHATLCAAAAEFLQGKPGCLLLMCGPGITQSNEQLSRLLAPLSSDQIRLLGVRDDMAGIYAASDIIVSSSSHGEGFPTVVAEGMAAGLPAVATDVGSSAEIVGKTGFVVPPRDPARLANEVIQLAQNEESLRSLGAHARARIIDNYSLERALSAHIELYRTLQ